MSASNKQLQRTGLAMLGLPSRYALAARERRRWGPRRVRVLAAVALMFAIRAGAATDFIYDDTFFKEHYSTTLRARPVFPPATPLLSSITKASPNGFATAVLTQTDPVKVPYDDETAHIEVTGDEIRPLYIAVEYFRSVSISWATDRILVIHRDIGHVAGMEEVIDVVTGRWLSHSAIFYRME